MDGPLDRHPCYISVVSINGSSTCLGTQARKEDPGNNRRFKISRRVRGRGGTEGGVGVAMGHMGQAAGGFRGPGVVPCAGTWGGSACARLGFPNRQYAIITIQYCALRVPLSAVSALVASCQARPTAAAADSAEAGERRRSPVAAAKRRPQMTARRRPTMLRGGECWCLAVFPVHGPWAVDAWPCSVPRFIRPAAEESGIDALAPGHCTGPS